MSFLTNKKLVIVGAAGAIGSTMAQLAAVKGLTNNITLYDPYLKGLEGVYEEMRHCGFEGVNFTFTDNVDGHAALLSYNIHVMCGSYVIVREDSTTLTIEIQTPAPALGRSMALLSGHILDSQPGNVMASASSIRRLL